MSAIFSKLYKVVFSIKFSFSLNTNIADYADDTLANSVNPLSTNLTKWSNCLSVFDHFVGLALKRVNEANQ